MAVRFYPLEKGGGGGKHLAWLKGGWAQQVLGVVLTRELEVLAILRGSANSVHPLEGGCKKFNPVLRAGFGGGGGHNKLSTRNYLFCSPPPPPPPHRT